MQQPFTTNKHMKCGSNIYHRLVHKTHNKHNQITMAALLKLMLGLRRILTLVSTNFGL